MDAFSSSPLTETFPPGRFDSPDISPAASPARTEVDFPIDVDQSFNSSMTLSTSDSPPAPSPCMQLNKKAPDMILGSPTNFVRRRPELGNKSYSALGSVREASVAPLKGSVRPLGPARTFGRELSLNARPPLSAQPSFSGMGKMLPPAVPEEKNGEASSSSSSSRRLVWNMSQEDMGSPKQVIMPRMNRRESAPTLESPRVARVAGADRMDIDSPQRSRPPSAFQSPSVHASPGLGSFFCESPAAPMLPPAKRRNIISSSPASPSSSPSTRRPRCDKTASSSALLFGVPRASSLATRRNAPYRRPPLQPVQPVDGPRSAASSTQSAYPILYGAQQPTATTMRRAISVCDQQMAAEGSDDESSDCDASPSLAATDFRRYGGHSRLNSADTSGSPKKASCVPCRPSSHVERSDKTSAAACGLPGFGDNEVDGKILPCHKVKEDGLVRITAQTMDRLLAGEFKDKMKRYHILDCRFDYEYQGGHIAGAINVRSMEQLDELVLRAQCGVNANDDLPTPSCSGELECSQQVVLIFHCEFSAKRAPTFAKHLRSRDRTINNASYPKIHYPELYILEGGYSSFYQTCPTRCDPQAYVAMDDPRHFERRNSDLHDFRKFSRTRSFTYGEMQIQPRAAPNCPPMAFAAASFAINRRGGTTIEEEHEVDSSPSSNSPCPRAVSMGQAPIFGSAKSRTLQRTGFQRVASCTDAMMRR